METVLAVIVTFNPDIILLKENIEALKKQVRAIIIFDNGSENIQLIRRLISDTDHIRLVENSKNLGLPVNYNRAARIAAKKGIPWLLIMDQDTIVSPHMISSFLKFAHLEDVAIITPRVWDVYNDREWESQPFARDEEYKDLEHCISSASLNRVETLFAIGGFDEKMFVDWVDFDFCKRVKIHGYRIIRVKECMVNQRFGDGPARKQKILWKTLDIMPYSAVRHYYLNRNKIYYYRKYKNHDSGDPGFLKKLLIVFKLIIRFCYEDHGTKKIRMVIKGFVDGYRMPVEHDYF